jgi:hypothetical protein
VSGFYTNIVAKIKNRKESSERTELMGGMEWHLRRRGRGDEKEETGRGEGGERGRRIEGK